MGIVTWDLGLLVAISISGFPILYTGSHDISQGKILHKLIQTDDFRVVVVEDVDTVEICGALKVCTILESILFIFTTKYIILHSIFCLN